MKLIDPYAKSKISRINQNDFSNNNKMKSLSCTFERVFMDLQPLKSLSWLNS